METPKPKPKSKGRGRPKKIGKPDYTTVKIDVKAYNDAKTLAYMTGRTVADVVSEVVEKHVGLALLTELRKRTGG